MLLLLFALPSLAVLSLSYDPAQIACNPSNANCDSVRLLLRERWTAQFQNPLDSTIFASLRRTPRQIVDVFLFNDEADLLEIRLATLDRVVDFHVAIEANFTLSGLPKKRWLATHTSEFSTKCRDRLRVHEAYAVARPATHALTMSWWDNEHSARQAQGSFEAVFRPGELNSDALVIHHDLDEIPSPEVLWLLKWCDVIPPLPLLFKLRFYYYGFFWRILRTMSDETRRPETDAKRRPVEWDAPLITTLEQARTILSAPPRALASHALSSVHDAGWHCSGCLSVEQLADKLRSFAHIELAQNPDLLTKEWLLHVKRTGIDYAMRVVEGYTVAVDGLLEAPPFVVRHVQLFRYMLFPPDHSAPDALPREHGFVPHTRRCTMMSHEPRSIFIDTDARVETIEKLIEAPEAFGAPKVVRWDLLESFADVSMHSMIERTAIAAVDKGNVVHHNLHITPKAIVVDHLIATVPEIDFLVLKLDVDVSNWEIYKNIIVRNASRVIDVLICEQRSFAENGQFATAFELLKLSNPSIQLLRWD
jgi:beta-1,4-mannosyl-glycoprotein beta-1,4-N-acetylglucosaminyltransferase